MATIRRALLDIRKFVLTNINALFDMGKFLPTNRSVLSGVTCGHNHQLVCWTGQNCYGKLKKNETEGHTAGGSCCYQ